MSVALDDAVLWMERGSLSHQNEPDGAGNVSAAASHVMVSAPWRGVRSNGRVRVRNVGNDDFTPGVSAHPGCIAAK